MKKFYCDRCGKEISGEPLSLSTSWDATTSMDTRKKLVVLMKPLENMDFCEECLEEIVDFALNKNVCDECVQQMAEENAMLREADEEVGSETLGETDPDRLDWNTALNRMEQLNHSDESPS